MVEEKPPTDSAPPTTGVAAVKAAHGDPAASMLLLRNIDRYALDPAYADAAQAPRPSPSVPRRLFVLLATIILAFASTAAVIGMRTWRAAEEMSPRAVLATQVRDGQMRVDHLTEQTESLEAQIRALEVLEGASVDRDSGWALSAGTTRVSGPGVVLSVSESSGLATATRPATFRDTDLRALKNLLWEGGAEAMSINGNRVGPATSVRYAGDAILVNLVAVSPPYVLEAIGDPPALMASLKEGSGAEQIRQIERATGVSISATRANDLIMPALALRASTVLPAQTG